MSLDAMKQALEAFDELLMSISLSFLRENVSHIDKYENGVKATRALRAAIKDAEKSRQWQGLTDEELRQAYCEVSGKEWCLGGLANAHTFYDVIEAKLKEKNA